MEMNIEVKEASNQTKNHPDIPITDPLPPIFSIQLCHRSRTNHFLTRSSPKLDSILMMKSLMQLKLKISTCKHRKQAHVQHGFQMFLIILDFLKCETYHTFLIIYYYLKHVFPTQILLNLVFVIIFHLNDKLHYYNVINVVQIFEIIYKHICSAQFIYVNIKLCS